jgi:hypothetical protein
MNVSKRARRRGRHCAEYEMISFGYVEEGKGEEYSNNILISVNYADMQVFNVIDNSDEDDGNFSFKFIKKVDNQVVEFNIANLANFKDIENLLQKKNIILMFKQYPFFNYHFESSFKTDEKKFSIGFDILKSLEHLVLYLPENMKSICMSIIKR